MATRHAVVRPHPTLAGPFLVLPDALRPTIPVLRGPFPTALATSVVRPGLPFRHASDAGLATPTKTPILPVRLVKAARPILDVRAHVEAKVVEERQVVALAVPGLGRRPAIREEVGATGVLRLAPVAADVVGASLTTLLVPLEATVAVLGTSPVAPTSETPVGVGLGVLVTPTEVVLPPAKAIASVAVAILRPTVGGVPWGPRPAEVAGPIDGPVVPTGHGTLAAVVHSADGRLGVLPGAAVGPNVLAVPEDANVASGVVLGTTGRH